MMHQTFEQGYRVLERFICGRVKICHSIKNHQNYILKSRYRVEGLFKVESETDTHLLNLLEDAYASTRYTHSYKITDKELEQLSQKLRAFIKAIEGIFNEALTTYKEIMLQEKQNKNTYQIKDKTEDVIKSDYLVRQLKFNNAYEMLCMAKTLMVLSVTCLQDDITPPITIYGFQYEINEVLQLAIKLLPLEETSP